MAQKARSETRRDGRATRSAGNWPGWMPAATRTYLTHAERGQTLRELAREADVHPSTILRRIRRIEGSREDPLLDGALQRLAEPEPRPAWSERKVLGEAEPILRRMAEPEAVLAVTQDLEKGVVARTGPEGEPLRLAVVDRAFVAELALRDWITCITPDARVQRYRITNHGRSLLRRLNEGAPGLAEEAAPFTGREEEAGDPSRRRRHQEVQPESPLVLLARRRDGTGRPFLSRDQLAAGEKLREDFLDALREGVGEGRWEALLLRLPGSAHLDADLADPHTGEGRVERALADLGPGLADVVLRTCCLLEGLETIEQRQGWSARSGKVVLRIALDRLAQHYRAVAGRQGLLRR